MSELYKNKYRAESNRLNGYDYGSDGMYFITICTANRRCEFGDISNGKMFLNDLGVIADHIWSKIPEQFPYINLGEFIIMPNHMHGVLIVDHDDCGDAINRVSTDTNKMNDTENPGGITGNHNPMLHQNISRVIRWYKGRVTFEIRKIYSGFAWQSNYHDHIIRNQNEFFRIENYIRLNPAKWNDDKFYES